MNLQQLDLSFPERVMFALRSLYANHGYARFKMNKFEEYDLYAGNREFLLSDSVLTFTDGNGKLMAMKPDVTLSIVKSTRDDSDGLQKLYYNENVYRAARGSNYKELMQVGLECIGNVGIACMAEVLELAMESLRQISDAPVLELSHLGLLADVITAVGIPEQKKAAALGFIGQKNLHELSVLCRSCGVEDEKLEILLRLLNCSGAAVDVLPELRCLLSDLVPMAPLEELEAVTGALKDSQCLRLDFSMVDDLHYYNGILFKGFLPGIPDSILSGGRYDNLMKKMGRRSGAIGFAVYVDRLERQDAVQSPPEQTMLNIALPKGRLGDKVYAMFEKAGFECPAIQEPGRKLIFENAEKGVRYFWVKPSDVAIYVERGAADIGVAGKDILLEQEPEIYELLDLNVGKCRMAVAAKNGFREDPGRTLRVATKFSNIAAGYYRSKGRDIDIIHLNGSIEIAPILGLSDVIVDIVETGTTLKENDLSVVETVVPISARLIANKAGYQFKNEKIDMLVRQLVAQLEE
ncbi:MAG: ATP phosphoribosyltransferase [Oscillospiraceae bacterium]|nr:ATP phosphoribosyltransferase [Oscillospiraceae bacterium]